MAYSVAAFLNATLIQVATHWLYPSEFLLALVRPFLTLFLALGLRRRARWAWWLSVTVPLVWGAAGVYGIVSAVREGGMVGFAGGLVTLLLLTGLLLAAVILLLLPQSRAAFRS